VDLGVVEPGERSHLAQAQTLVVEQHGGRNERTREAAPTRLVGAGDVASTERAVEPEKTPGRATPAARGSPSVRAASR
jgi:hypothetical protein